MKYVGQTSRQSLRDTSVYATVKYSFVGAFLGDAEVNRDVTCFSTHIDINVILHYGTVRPLFPCTSKGTFNSRS